VDSIIYLGHELNHQGIRPDSNKLEVVAEFTIPAGVLSSKSYLGIVSFYS